MLATILFSLLALAIVAYISYPLLCKSPKVTVDVGSGEEGSELLAERDSINLALEDLDSEYEFGKVADEDYQRLRRELLTEAESVSARIESDSTISDAGTPPELQSADIVEDEIARYKKEREGKESETQQTKKRGGRKR